ncbi:MAG TPA: metalloregulator ArsR/SmtB family transcription factor [Mycobacteriales bacterium]|nr:metalloregulator ArsR/SmtB family transcription factor [Mycobacteriales bacterium]
MKATDELSVVFAALADPTRREILDRLGAGPASVATLRAPLPMSAPAVSQHLAVLERAGLIERAAPARHRLVTARPERLDEAARWVQRHRREWTERLDRLERRVDALREEEDG